MSNYSKHNRKNSNKSARKRSYTRRSLKYGNSNKSARKRSYTRKSLKYGNKKSRNNRSCNSKYKSRSYTRNKLCGGKKKSKKRSMNMKSALNLLSQYLSNK